MRLRLLLPLVVLALPLGAQNYPCSQMYGAVTHATVPTCALQPGTWTLVWDFHVWTQNTSTGANLGNAYPETSGTGYSFGQLSGCKACLPYQNQSITNNGSNWNWRDQITSFSNFCLSSSISFSPVTSQPMASCPCVSSTCGKYGCPACPVSGPICPTPNSSCSASGGVLANFCLYPGGCPFGYVTTYIGGAPCCQSSSVSPIIIDVDGSGYSLTSAAKGVKFDFFGRGTPVQMSWTSEGSTNAFLVLDRNGNGLIDNGAELFGNLTPQPKCGEPNGFAALQQYDSNHDGVIDSTDSAWSLLRLWQDVNHDGISQPEELHSLDALGVVSISLNYQEHKWTDLYGNQFRYRAKVTDAAGKDGKWAYDVFFQVQK